MFRSRAPRILNSLRTTRRFIHHVPRLTHEDTYVSKGVDGFLSPQAFDLSWTQYQSWVISRLNTITAGGEDAGKTVKQVLIRHAREPALAATFNYASMAHNNAFFFEGLSPTPVAMPAELEAQLKASFGSIETLKREMTITANSMFGPGFVWLVKEGNQYSVLCTYLAGTPYAEGHYRRQNVDMNTEDKSIPEAVRRVYRQDVANTAGSHGSQSELAPSTTPGAAIVTPILCLNTWEHVYLMDYGVGLQGGGKQEYAEKWWDRIDWVKVADMAAVNSKPQLMK